MLYDYMTVKISYSLEFADHLVWNKRTAFKKKLIDHLEISNFINDKKYILKNNN